MPHSEGISTPSGTTTDVPPKQKLRITRHNIVNVAFGSVVLAIIACTSIIVIGVMFQAPVVVLGHFVLRTVYTYLPPFIPTHTLEGFSEASLRSTLILAAFGAAASSLPIFLVGVGIAAVKRLKQKRDGKGSSSNASKQPTEPLLPSPLRQILPYARLAAIGPIGIVIYRAVFGVQAGEDAHILGAGHAAASALRSSSVAMS